jgi:hypothetical protein
MISNLKERIARKLKELQKIINILSKQLLSFSSTADIGQGRRPCHRFAWSPLFGRRSKAPDQVV